MCRSNDFIETATKEGCQESENCFVLLPAVQEGTLANCSLRG